MDKISFDVYMVDSLLCGGVIILQSKKPINVGAVLLGKETWAIDPDGTICYKQIEDEQNVTRDDWRWANQMPEKFSRFSVEVVACERTTKKDFWANYGQCIFYNRRLWMYNRLAEKRNEWFRARIWQSEDDKESDQIIYAIHLKIKKGC